MRQRRGAETGGRDRGQRQGAETGGRDRGQRLSQNLRSDLGSFCKSSGSAMGNLTTGHI
jgi:hypothetical protein